MNHPYRPWVVGEGFRNRRCVFWLLRVGGFCWCLKRKYFRETICISKKISNELNSYSATVFTLVSHRWVVSRYIPGKWLPWSVNLCFFIFFWGGNCPDPFWTSRPFQVVTDIRIWSLLESITHIIHVWNIDLHLVDIKEYQPPMPPPPRSNALLKGYEPPWSLNNPLIRPDFFGYP